MSLASVLRDLGHKRWFARVGRVLVRADRRVGLLTKGRLVAFGSRELPSMLITTTGARSGLRRTSPLLYVTDGDAYIVVGSNWGQSHHPAWSANLIAHPDATVTIRGRTTPVRAQLMKGSERDRLWDLMRQMWPAYDTYAQRAGREIRVFRLVPTR